VFDYYHSGCLQDEVTNNFVNGRPLVYLQQSIGGTVPNDAGQIVLINCSSLFVTDQNLCNASIGLIALHCSDLNIKNTHSHTNTDGFVVRFSNHIDIQ
ncbi:MAG: hypothetical protein ACFFDT_40295, partial [Candidatus Hodarchaeota archaeon]